MTLDPVRLNHVDFASVDGTPWTAVHFAAHRGRFR